MTKSRRFIFSVFLFLLSISVVVFLRATSNGIGVLPDSVSYFTAAENLLNGGDLINYDGTPMTHWPPFYPIVLSICGLLGDNPVDTSRYFHAFFYSLNLFLFCLIIYLCANRKIINMILGGVFFLSSRSILYMHVFALSEPLFLALLLMSMLFLFLYFQKEKERYMFLFSIFLSLAIGTRYIGITLLPSFILVLLMFSEKPKKTKIINLLLITITSLAPMGLWIIRNFALTGSTANRNFQYNPIETDKLTNFINTAHDFYVSLSRSQSITNFNFFIGIAIVAFIIFITMRKKKMNDHIQPNDYVVITFGLIFFVSYVFFLLFSISFFDASTPIDTRLLSPVFVALTVSLFDLIEKSKITQNHRVSIIVIALMVLLIGNNIPRFIKDIARYSKGMGYNSPWLDSSPTLNLLKSMHPNEKIITNARDLVFFKTGLLGEWFPSRVTSSNSLPNEQFEEEIVDMCERVTKGDAVIVYLNFIQRWYHPSEKELTALCNLEITNKLRDGFIYGSSTE